mgnify:FL=1
MLMFITAREMLIDVQDCPGDLRAGVRTLAGFLGTTAATWIATTIMLASTLLGAALVSGSTPRLLLGLGCLGTIASMLRFHDHPASGLQMSRIPLALGALALARATM